MHLRTRMMKSTQRLSRASFRDSYWTLAHQGPNGCNPDLLGSGTISGVSPGSFGSLMVLTQAGRRARGIGDDRFRQSGR